ncbi:MAG: AMP-binding protein [Saprospirales bacterium]|nr:AMP-binding protein [Saprospirales bacterium]
MIPKLSYVCGSGDIPLLGQTIGILFDSIVEQYPDNDALIVPFQQVRWTYRQLSGQVDACARALLAKQIQKGDRVGIWSPNGAEWTVLQLASAKVGAILVNINPSYRLHELEYALQHSGCKMIVTADRFKYSEYLQMLNDLIPELQYSTPGKLQSARFPELKTVIHLSEEKVSGAWTWKEFLHLSNGAGAEDLAHRRSQLSFDDPINIQYTSGTTGRPKGATLSHHNILNNAFFVAETMKFTPKDRVIIPVPLYHCFGMVIGNLGCITHGATMIYPSEGFEAGAVLKAVQDEKATAVFGVPTMFIAELEDPEFDKYDLSSLRTGIMAGSPCPIEVMKRVQTEMHMPEVQIAYGMTETSPVSTQTRPGTSIEKQVSTVGQIHPHLEIKIIDPRLGLTLPLGQAGELCTRGYSIMLGYWNEEERTREAIDSARWMHSGDLATMDEDGYIKIVGRIKDMIIRGGENIYPREIEEFLYTHPKIQDVQVIGIPDVKYGEEVMAWIKLREGETLTAEEITEFCKGKITHFKIPKFFKFTDEFPLTVTGKVQKFKMRELSIEELGLRKAAEVAMA